MAELFGIDFGAGLFGTSKKGAVVDSTYKPTTTTYYPYSTYAPQTSTVYSPQTTTTTSSTYAPQYAYTTQVAYNSAGSSFESKKEQKSNATSTAYATPESTAYATPTSTVSASPYVPSTDLTANMDSTSLILVAAVLGAAYVLGRK